MKIKIIPFDLETAKKIQAGEIEGRIKCNEREFHKIICFDAIGLYPIVALLYDGVDEVAFSFSKNGYSRSSTAMKLFIELSEEAPICNNPDSPICKVCSNIHCNDCQYNAPKHEFKPFDKMLVRDRDDQVWHISLYESCGNDGFYVLHGIYYKQCIPYAGNESLVGTTDKPKEE